MKTHPRTRVLVVAMLVVCLAAIISFGSVRSYIAKASSAMMSVIIGQNDIAVPRPAQARSLATADLDGNGTPDVVVGFTADDGTGVIQIYRGNTDAFAPTDDSVFVNIQNGYRPASLLGKPRTFQVPEPVDFVQLGDFDQNGLKDVLCAARDGNLYLLAGDLKGRFLKARQIELPGPVTALGSGEFGTFDGRDDVAVGVSGPSGFEVLIYDGATGGFDAQPVQVSLSGPATAIEFGGLDDDPYQDLAVAGGSEIAIVHGQSRRENLAAGSRVERVEAAGAIRGISIGEFAWDRNGRSEIAALSYDGTLHIFKNAKLDERPFTEAEAAERTRGNLVPRGSKITDLDSLQSWRQGTAAGWTESKSIMATSFAGVNSALAKPLVRVNYSYRETNDLMMLGQDQGKLEIVRPVTPDEKARGEFFAEGDLARNVLDAPAGPVAVLQLPRKINGETDLLVLSSTSTDIGVISFAPNTTITVDRTDDPSGAGLTAASACTAAASDCSLRGAIQFANLPANANTTISLPANTYILSINGTNAAGCDGNTVGDLGANTSMTIVGAGAATTIVRQTGTGPANDGDRVMCMNEPFTTNLIYNFSAVTFVGGRDGTAAGTGSAIGGGGIIGGELNNSLTLTNVVFANNQVTVLGSGNIGGGGLQITGGSMTITNSTFGGTGAVGAYTDRTSTTIGNLNAGSGGGVMYTPSSPAHSGGSGTLTVTGSTFSRNNSGSVCCGGGGVNTGTFAFAAPGGIGSGSASIGTSTFSNNQATSGSGGGLLAESLATSVATTSFTNNSAGRDGGAVSGGSQTLTLNGTSPSITMTGNTAPRGSAVSSGGPVSVTGTNTTLSGSILVHSNGVWTNAAGSILAPTDIVLEGGTLVMNSSTMNVAGNISIGPTQNNLIPGGFDGGSGTMNLGGNLTFNNTAGTSFTGGTGTINFNGTTAQSITNNASITFFNLTDSNTTQPLTFNNSLAVNGSLNANGANTILNPVAGTVISGTGTLTGSGTARVTRTAATADFLSQYSITNKTLTNLLVDYVGTAAQVCSTITYGNLRINNASGVTLAGGTATVNGLLTLASGALGVGTQVLLINNGTSVGGGSITSSATGTVHYNQSSDGQNVLAFNYGNLTFSNFNKVLAGTGTIGIAGVFIPGTATGHTITASTINFNGTGAQTVPAFNYNNLTISGARGANNVTLVNGGTIGVAGVFNPSATFAGGTYVVTNNTVDFNSAGAQTVPAFNYFNLTSSNGGARTLANSGTIGIANVWTQGASAYTAAGSTINFNGTGAQSINPFNYNNLTISGARGANNVTLPNGGTIGVAGIFSPTATFAGGAYVVTGNTFVFNGSALQSIPAFTFNNLTLNNAAGANLAGNVTVGGTMTLQSGNLGVGTNTLTLNGAATSSGGTFSSAATGTVNYNQSSNGQVVLPGNYGNLTFSNFTKDLTNATVGIAGVFTPGSAVGHTITSSTFVYNGTTSQTLPAGFATYNNLTLNNAAGVTGFAGLTVQNLLRVQAGTFTSSSSYKDVQIDSGATLAGVAATTINISGNWTNNGSFNANSNTVNFNGTAAQTIGGSSITTFNNLIVNNPSAGVGMTANVAVNGTLTLTAGTLSVGASTLTINAGTSQTAGILASGAAGTVNYNQASNGQAVLPGSYGNLTFSGFNKALPSTGTIGVAGTFTPGAAIGHTITGSTFDFNGTSAQTVPVFSYNNLTVSGARGGGTVTLASGTISVAGAFSPTATGVVYSSTGNTFAFNSGGAQTIPAFASFNNLSTVTGGTKTLGGNASAAGVLTIGTGTTLDCGGFGLNIGGDIVADGTFTCPTGTLSIIGPGAQTLGGTTPITLNNLVMNSAGGLTLNFNTTVNGILTLQSGEIITGANTLVIGSAGSANRTSGHVVGTMQKVFGGIGAFTYHVGTAGVYSPVDVNMTAGNGALSIKANSGTVPSTPALDPAKMLQRFWTLTETGDITVSSVFHYLQTDVPVTSDENQYGIFRVVGGALATRFNTDGVNFLVDPTLNTFTVNNMSVFSDWSAGDPLAPTAASVRISGRVLTADGAPIYMARVTIVDQFGVSHTSLTNQFGNYFFDDIEPGHTYLISARHRAYTFGARTITVTDSVADFNFFAEP